MANENSGALQIKTQTARGALPVPGAQIYVRSTDQNGTSAGVVAAGRTDTSGMSEIYILPAPPMENSEVPDKPPAFYKYQVEVTAEGYYPEEKYDVPIFPGILSTQTVTLLPTLSNSIEKKEETE